MEIKPNWCILWLSTIIISTSFCFNNVEGVRGGLSFSPMPELVNSNLIYYKAKNQTSVLKWTTIIDGFLDKYRTKSSDTENRIHCNYDFGPVQENQVCDVPLDDFHACNPANQYNYHKAAPCVFLKLNEVLDWRPELYNTTDNLPQAMPEDLKKHIEMVSGRPAANAVWVSCEGENPTDVEFIGPVQYIPRRGFPSYYYPFTNKEGYLSPLVAVLFERPMTGVLINIECKAWARNIDDGYERRGSVHFELMVD